MKPLTCVLLLFLFLFSYLPTRAQNRSNRFTQMRDSDSLRFRQLENLAFLMDRATPVQRSIPATGLVSAHELLIPSKARKEFERGHKAYLEQDFPSAAEHWEKAIQIHPDFFEARNNLGSAYVTMGEYEKALPEFKKAIALDPKKIQPYKNLSWALGLLHRDQDSEMSARQALQIEPHDVTSHCLLGRALAAQRNTTKEAVDSLRNCRDKMPESRLLLIQALLRRGERDQAVAELRDYLQVAAGPDKQTAQCWLALLTHADSAGACHVAQETH